MSEISRVGVVGAGLMGSGIAEVCARAGLDVQVSEVTKQAADAGRARIEKSIARAQKSGKLSADEGAETLARIRFTTDLDDMSDRDFVVEAIAENEALKVDVFSTLDKVLENPDAVLASNTSSIPIMKLAMATQRPHRVLGVHFFNPAPVLRLVEVIPSLLTDEQTRSFIEEFVSKRLGKTVVRSTDRAGFVVNALLIPYILSAIRMLESGFASAEDIDNGMVLGCAHPMGPLALADLIGLDTTMAVAESMYAEFKEPLYSPPPMLLRMVDAGLLGKKAGRGFHEYPR
ncbi:3-hydroxybutyryl-CoA dehydrogenase [Pseudonocardia asaccharolytica]|uniref:3-hydroxybutyryl-CoA dehydrogenase n=1 Tax=Pseudonocardia asaccharolytica DSM 44247 = NBRC 16224 TaxID=1123024 RepID=A0A511D6N8_9PSEU|nr:3-hydroxybutyryl-CoA dehydrogenase [Pseudonocardia asaccharolytica]GEL20459.1 3-hydroxybutyryl-CoA dehydrogenase [Pseudonocardia asaccharolytica DSM 44247 = NBRC 16224]